MKQVLNGQLLLVTVILLLMNSKPAAAQSPRFDLQDTAILSAVFDTVIQKRMAKYHVPGFAIAVVKNGKIHWSKGYGVSDLDTQTPVTADQTIFRIGSITKLFTATSIMQMVEEKKIGLHDDINKYTDDKLVYKNGVPITLHHLLTHSAGFREIPGRKTTSAAKILPPEVFLKDRLIQDRAAGEAGSYGTYQVALTGRLLEIVSGKDYRKYLQTRIFDPLQMTHTNATDVSEENRKYLATGYVYKNDNYRKQDFEYYHTYPASDINSTANDMANFMIMHLSKGKFNGKTLLKPETATSMMSTQFRNHPNVVGFGYGFWESSINGTKAFYHGGIMDGYASSIYLWPEKDLGLFIVCNSEATNFLSSMLNNFIYYFFPSPPDNPVPSANPALQVNLSRFAGKYRRIDGPALDIKLNADSTISFWGGRWLQIKPMLFQLTNGLLDTGEDLIAFKENDKGEIVWMTTGPFVYIKQD